MPVIQFLGQGYGECGLYDNTRTEILSKRFFELQYSIGADLVIYIKTEFDPFLRLMVLEFSDKGSRKIFRN